MIEQDGFLQRFRLVVSRIGKDGISRRQAARELKIGYATLKRLLDANFGSSEEDNGNDDRQHYLLSQPVEEEEIVMTCT